MLCHHQEEADALNHEAEETVREASTWHMKSKCCCRIFKACCGNDYCVGKCCTSLVAGIFVLLGFGMIGLGAYMLDALQVDGQNVFSGTALTTV